MLKLKVLDTNRNEKAESTQGTQVSLVYKNEYAKGDNIILKTEQSGVFCIVQFEDSMPPAFVYVVNNAVFHIPFNEERHCYSPKNFVGNVHVIRARLATKEEINAYKNLAFNPYDQHGDNDFFPHSYANVETRGEAVFASRNAIDGIFENSDHGYYPYQSWGINRDPNATMTINFGRKVLVDKIAITIRADFPHDSFWEKVTLKFSDGSAEEFHLEKTAQTQYFSISKREIEWAEFCNLIKADDESPFPALTQLEIFGNDIQEEIEWK